MPKIKSCNLWSGFVADASSEEDADKSRITYFRNVCVRSNKREQP